MADVAESIVPPPAADQTDNLTIWWVPSIADVLAPKVTEIGGTGAFRVTYSFTNDGWSIAGSQTKTKDERLTLKQPLESLGATDVALNTLKYVESSQAGSANVVLLEGTAGFFVERRGIPNKTLAAAAQKVRVIPAILGAQLPGPTDGTGKFTIVQETALTGLLGLPVALV
ncbi:phage tail tube protein [Leifsonia poae]|uniref:phage tail tube protein n=1 Tax=Leifsonia poae TaxID=110933 RepID=UPI001CBAAA3D|nr:hypothetical protein [Leifsonia poae]